MLLGNGCVGFLNPMCFYMMSMRVTISLLTLVLNPCYIYITLMNVIWRLVSPDYIMLDSILACCRRRNRDYSVACELFVVLSFGL